MEWQDNGLILGVRKHGETSSIVEVMTQKHGRHLGLVRGGRSKRLRPVLQPGNTVHVEWRARLEEHLGTFSIEGETLRAAQLMEQPLGIYGLQTLASHLRLLPERDPQPGLLEAANIVLGHFDEPEKAARLIIRFELAILDELGFGLDLSRCAATASRADLIWVSPKTGRAVGFEAGKPYADKLLTLPRFLLDDECRALISDQAQERECEIGASASTQPIADGFELSHFFLQRHVYGPRGLRPPDERANFVQRVVKALEER